MNTQAIEEGRKTGITLGDLTFRQVEPDTCPECGYTYKYDQFDVRYRYEECNCLSAEILEEVTK